MGLMRRVALAAFLLGPLAGCAHIEAPPGGPEDKQAPRLIATRPETLTVRGPFQEAAVLVFDERVAEQSVRNAVDVSPRTSAMQVSHRGDEIRVSLRRGWEADRIYQVTAGPGLQDLFGNRSNEPVRLVFSTGPDIPDTQLTGTVTSRTTGQPEVGARVEAILPDSLVYAIRTDSSGAFAFRQIPVGEYFVRAYLDRNEDRQLQDYEARDTARATVAVGATPTVRLRLLEPDSTPPRAESVEVEDSAWIQVKFDDYLDPAQAFAPTQVRVLLADSTPIQAVAVELGPPEGGAGRSGEPADTTAAGERAAGSERLPSQSIRVRLARPVPPDTEFVVHVTGVRNLVGLVGGGEAKGKTPLAVPPPPPEPTDSAAPTP